MARPGKIERLFRHDRRPGWGLGRLVADRGDRFQIAFEDGTTRVLLAAAPGLRELDPTDVLIEQRIAEELERFGTLCPRWIKFPMIPRGSMGWRMGSGEFYGWMLSEHTSGWTAEQHVEHLRRYAPIPIGWTFEICNVLGLPDAARDLEARASLAARGLLRRHPDAIDRCHDELTAPSREAVDEAIRAGDKEQAGIVLTVAMLDDDRAYSTRLCVDALGSPEDAVRAAGAAGLGHVARRHGTLDRALAGSALVRALADEGRYVRPHAEAARLDIEAHAGWGPADVSPG